MSLPSSSSSTRGPEGVRGVLEGTIDLLQWVPGIKQLKFEQEDANRVQEGTTDPWQRVSLKQFCSRLHLRNLL